MRPTRFLLFLYLFVCSLYLATNSGRLNLVDAASMFGVTKSLVVSRDFSNFGCTPSLVQCVPGKNGKNYSAYGPVTSLCHVGSYIIGATAAKMLNKPERLVAPFLVVLVHSCFAALVPVVFCAWLWRLGFSLPVACVFALLLAFGTPFWFYATKGLFSEPYALLGIIASVYFLQRASTNTKRSFTLLLLAGAAFGFAIGARVVTVAMYPALIVYFLILVRGSLLSKDRLQQTVAFHLPLAVTVLLLAWFNYARFGSVSKSGYHTLQNSVFTGFSVKELGTLLFSGAYGLLWFSTFVVLLPFVAKPFYMRYKPEAILCAAILLLNLIIHSSLSFDAGWAYGPRYLLLTLPFMLPPFALLWTNPTSQKLRTLFLVFVVASFAVQVQSVMVPIGRYFNLSRYNNYTGERPWWNGSLLLHNIDASPKVLGLVPGWKVKNPAGLQEAASEGAAFNKGMTNRNPQDLLESMPGGINLVLPDFWWLKLSFMGFPRALVALMLAVLVAAALWSGRQLRRMRHIATPGLSIMSTPSIGSVAE